MAWPVTARNEIEMDMCSELLRFLTFMTFPLDVSVSGLKLACSGFFYTGIGALVRCFSCHRNHSNWQTESVLFQVGNFMHESDCALILGTGTQNVPMHRQSGHDQQVGDRNFLLSPTENESPYLDEEMAASNILTSTSGAVFYDVMVDLATYRRLHPSERPSHPLYAGQEMRLASFSHSPSHLQARARTLCESGFFYFGTTDRVRCFHCGYEVTIRGEEVNTWAMHVEQCPNCALAQ